MTKSIIFALVLLAVVTFTKARSHLHNQYGPWPENWKNASVFEERFETGDAAMFQGLQRMPKNLHTPQHPQCDVEKIVGDTVIRQHQREESRREFGGRFDGKESNGQMTRAGEWSYDGGEETAWFAGRNFESKHP